MKLVVGLGNPGIEHQFTWHNLGFLTIDRIADRCNVDVVSRRCHAATAKVKLAGKEVLLAKPETYMNLSGLSVRRLADDLGIQPASDLIVVYDELDFPFGKIQIREKGGSAGHKGIESVTGALGSDQFVRVRLGIKPDHPVQDGARFVLSQFKKSQMEAIDGILDRAADAVELILKDGVPAAMNVVNRRPEKAEEGSAS